MKKSETGKAGKREDREVGRRRGGGAGTINLKQRMMGHGSRANGGGRRVDGRKIYELRNVCHSMRGQEKVSAESFAVD